MDTFYTLSAESISGAQVSMKDYKGKVILVVNTASKCGFTPQFEGLERLYKMYKDRGLVVLGFPCNQFAKQDPGSSQSIAEVCFLNYGVTFPMFQKVLVNGKNAHPIFVFLKTHLKGLMGGRIKWNFTKFLLDQEGHPLKRYAPKDTPAKIESDIVALLGSELSK